MPRINWPNALVTTIVSYLGGYAALILLFGNPLSQRLIYTDSFGQSSKLIAVWKTLEPIPPANPFWDQLFVFSGRKFAVLGLLLVWAFGVVLIYATVYESLPGEGWRKGLSFAAIMWAMAALFFEAFTPFNMFGEPFGLVLYELALWALGLAVWGILIAVFFRPPQPDSAPNHSPT